MLKMTGNFLEQEILNYLSFNLSPKRYYHCLCVTNLAVKLAKFYNENIYEAQTSALLHDCAKCMDLREMKNYINKNKLKIPHCQFIIENLPQVLHSYVGADIAKKKFNIKNKIIINAIKHHTIGRTNMSNCEKILFVADSLSKDRIYPNRNKYNKLLFNGLDNIFKIVLSNKINYILSNFNLLHPDIINIWNFYNRKNI